jgi:protein TonB
MTRSPHGDLLVAAGLAAAVHALLFVALPVALVSAPAQAGQSPGVTSLEIALAGPSAPSAPPRRGSPTSPTELPKEPEPWPLPEVSQAEPAEAIHEPEPALVRPEQVPEVTQPEALRPGPPGPGSQPPSGSSSGAKAAMVGHHNIRYPERALAEGRTGAPVVRVEVLASGRAGAVELVEGSGHADLDEAAVNGLKTAWYRPANDGRRPVGSTKLFQPRFVIEDGRAKVQ